MFPSPPLKYLAHETTVVKDKVNNEYFNLLDQAVGEYNVLSWTANANDINIWLKEQNYER